MVFIFYIPCSMLYLLSSPSCSYQSIFRMTIMDYLNYVAWTEHTIVILSRSSGDLTTSSADNRGVLGAAASPALPCGTAW